MDAEQFDGLVRTVTEHSSRRSLLGVLAGLPVAGGFLALLAQEDADAHGRRKRRKKRHKHGDGRRRKRRKRKKTCTPEAVTITCAGKCGSIANNCRKMVDCGACACTAHHQCGPDALCVDGGCHACNVVAGESLADAVSAARDGATLYVCPGTYGEGLNIGRPITIIGAGQTADGGSIVEPDNPGSYPVSVSAGSPAQPVVLRNLRLQKGSTGVFINPGMSVVMIDCTVRENYSNPPGAGVHIGKDSTARLTGCTIEKNTVNTSWGGGIFNNQGEATLSNCLIRDNRAPSGAGIMNLNGVLTLRQTQVRENESSFPSYPGCGIDNNGGVVNLVEGSAVCANEPWETQCNGFDGGDACTETCPGG